MTIGDGIAFSVFCLCIAAVVIVRRWQEVRCQHDWTLVGKMASYLDANDKLPVSRTETYRCGKCGSARRYKL